MKKRVILKLAVILTLAASASYAGNVGVDLNIHLGDQPRQIVVPGPAAPPLPMVRIDEDVNFIFPQALGFYVAVGVPYDLFYVGNSYYVYRDGAWLRASASRGPWVVVGRRDLPPPLRRHQIERIRAYRNAEYDVYRRDRDHYRGKHFLTGREEWKERRRDEKEHRKDEKREEKENRKHDRDERRGRD
jgi:hypothetical protein